MAASEKEDILMRLRTIRGHISGIEKMIEEEKVTHTRFVGHR